VLRQETATAVAVAEEPDSPAPSTEEEISPAKMRDAVLAALEDASQHVLAHNLEEGEWSMRGIEVTVKVAMSQALLDMAVGAETRRVIIGALNNAAGKPLRFKAVSGGSAMVPRAAAPRPANGASGNGAGARSRAMQDPVVQRMQEKFGAEIRTVIDQKNRS
jgi:hypothetical protein